jgi:hypothetical protein
MLKSFILLLGLSPFFLNNAFALECWGRIGYFQDEFSNKCMECQKVSISHPGQDNCKFPNTDHCCESNLCNEDNPNFMNWVNEVCKIPE